MADVDVTDSTDTGGVDSEAVPMTKCVCGATWRAWDGPILTPYQDMPTKCYECDRQFYATVTVRVFEVQP